MQLAWEAPATNTDGTPLTVAGYKLYYGQSSGTYSSVLDIGNQTTYTVTGLTAGSTYYFAVTVYDAWGKESTFSNEVSATLPPGSSDPPVASFNATPTSGPLPLTVAFTDTSTGQITAWAFGDGATSTAQHPSHTYTDPGAYTVSLTVTGPGGTDSATKTSYITVTDPPPVAGFSATPTSGSAPVTVAFTDTSTGQITAWAWAFGDGATSTAQHPSHTYTDPGAYTVSLTVTGPGGSDSATKTSYITITDPPPVASFEATPTTGETPLQVTFTDSSTGAITSWAWDFGDGATSTEQHPTYTYTEPGTYTVSLTVTGPGGTDSVTKTGYITVDPPLPLLVTGEVEVDHQWTGVNFAVPFVDPIVVATPASANDPDPVVIRLRNVSPTGFEIRLQEWEYLDDLHARERVSYLVLERGHYTLPDGTQLEVDRFDTSATSSFVSLSFQTPFATTPVVVTTITSVNEDEAVVSRLRNITPTGFEFRLQEQEANPQVHASETVTYLAWEPSVGAIGNLQFEVGRTPDVVNHLFQRIDFTAAFADSPVLVAEMQTADGMDTANLRWQAKTSSGVEGRVAEEQSKDSETNHTTEVVGYLVLSLEN